MEEGITTWTTDNPARQERQYRRFKLSCPVHVEFHSGEIISRTDTVSRNVSAGGLLLDAPILIPQGSSVSFIMILRSGQFVQSIKLVGQGEVMRVEACGPEPEFGIAVKCTSPITQIEHFSAPGAHSS